MAKRTLGKILRVGKNFPRYISPLVNLLRMWIFNSNNWYINHYGWNHEVMELDSSWMFSLDGSSKWQIWKRRMEDLLYSNNLEAPINGESSKPQHMRKEDWNLLNRRTVAYIRLGVDDSLYQYISDETSAYSLWKKLEELFERKNEWEQTFLGKKAREPEIWRGYFFNFQSFQSDAKHNKSIIINGGGFRWWVASFIAS